jgi:hypothetical protein
MRFSFYLYNWTKPNGSAGGLGNRRLVLTIGSLKPPESRIACGATFAYNRVFKPRTFIIVVLLR